MLYYYCTSVPYLVFFLLYLNSTYGTMADCHFSYREPHCRPSSAAPTLAFWGAYAAGARERDGRLPGVRPSRKWRALKRLREGGYVREFARPREMAVCHAFGQGAHARWPFARQRAARWPFARQRAAAQVTLAKFLELGQSHLGRGLPHPCRISGV